MSAEKWLPVVGYEGFYEVSDLGNVRSVDRKFVTARGQLRTYPGVPMKVRPQPNGYLTIGLKKAGSVVRKYAHRLVMEAFVDQCPDGMEVRHLDGDPTNNRLDNLKYGTHSENMKDRVAHGNDCQSNRTHCPRGHELSGENLVASHLKRGMRDCRCCAVVLRRVRYGRVSDSDFEKVANELYAEYKMGVA